MDEELKTLLEKLEDRITKLEGQIGTMNLRGLVKSRKPTLWDAVCSDCGKECKVPFKPRYKDKKIYCKTCFLKHREKKRY